MFKFALVMTVAQYIYYLISYQSTDGWVAAMITVNALYDWYQIHIKIRPSHIKETVINILLISLISICYNRLSPTTIVTITQYFAIRWILFDLVINLFRGERYDYIGEIDPADPTASSLLDRFLHRVGIDWQYPIKLGTLAIVLFLNYFIINFKF